jgi:hypothetical protein
MDNSINYYEKYLKYKEKYYKYKKKYYRLKITYEDYNCDDYNFDITTTIIDISNKLDKYSFYRDLDNTIDNYKKELPKAIEYIQTLFLMSDGIDTL